MLKARALPDPQAAQAQSRWGQDELALVLGWGTWVGDRSCPVILTGSLCTGKLSCHDPGERCDSHQGPHMQERRCALWNRKGQERLSASSRAEDAGHQHPPGLSLSMGQAAVSFSVEDTGSPGTLGARILPVSELFFDVDPYPAFRTSVWRNGSDLKALSCSEGPGEPAGGPPPPLTCREMRSTSHSSSHSWATADMATTVATRMATSPICRGRATRRSGGARARTAQGSPVCGGGREEVQRQREGPSHGWGEWGVRERPT